MSKMPGTTPAIKSWAMGVSVNMPKMMKDTLGGSMIAKGAAATMNGEAIKHKKYTGRIALYTAGVVIMAFGISAVIRADIGIAPGGVIPIAVSKLTPLTVGLCIAMFHAFCAVMQLVITRKLTLKLVLQLPMAYVFGFLIDRFCELLEFPLNGFGYKILLLLGGLMVLSLGIRIIVGVDLMLSPPDGLAFVAGDKLGWSKSKSKLIFDVVVTVIAAALTLVLAGDAFLSVGIGTVICAAGTGPIIGLYTKLIRLSGTPE